MKERYIKKIDFVFFNEKNIRETVFEVRESSPKFEIKNGSKISDPTASQAIKNLTPIFSITIGNEILKFPESWLLVIDKTYTWCKKQSALLYETVRRKYSGEHYRKICFDLHFSHVTFKNFIDKARIYAALQAVQLRLIYVD